MPLTTDDFLRKIGEFNRFQWLVIGIVGYAHLALGGFTVMIVSFITAEPDWECVKDFNSSICNFTEPIGLTSDDYNARCDMPREAWKYVAGFTSLVTEYDLVCEKSLLLSIAQSCNFIGMCLGLVLAGYISDRFGRKKAFCFGLLCTALATWIMVFPRVFLVFIITRMMSGFGSGFRNTVGFVMIAEITTERYRAKATIFPFYFWVVSLLTISGMAYLIPNWRSLLLFTAVCNLPCLFYYWFFPESPRWLLLHRKEDEARKQLEKIAKLNRREFPEEAIKEPEPQKKAGNLTYLFYSWTVGRTTLISWNMWFGVALVYYGVSFGSVDLGGNRYLNFALISLVELPANFASRWSVDRFGRKKTLVTGLMAAFVCAIIVVCIPANRSNSVYNDSRVVISILAKFFVTINFTVSYVWTSELFPTFVRTMGISTSSAAATIGSFAASYVIWLIRIHPLLPYGIMGMISLQASIVVSILPETKGQSTLETMQDMMDSHAKRTTVENTLDEEEQKLTKNETGIKNFVTSV